MNLQLKDITLSTKDFNQINALYHRAFPDDERAPMQMLLAKAKENKGAFYGIYDDEKWVGMVYIITYQQLSYVFYLAIDEKYRGQGYGSALLHYLQKKLTYTLMLSIEEVDEKYDNYQQRYARKRFYLKNGMQEMNFHFREYGVRYEMLYYGQYLPSTCYDELMISYAGERYMEIREDEKDA